MCVYACLVFTYNAVEYVYMCFYGNFFQPFLLGKAVLSLKQCLTANQLRSRFVVEVKAPQSVAMKGTTARPEPLKGTTARPESLKGTTARPEPLTSREEHIIGNLEVCIKLAHYLNNPFLLKRFHFSS